MSKTLTQLPTAAWTSAVERLRSDIRGRVLTAGDAECGAAVATFNPTVQHHPDVVVEATDSGDVAAALQWAVDRRLSWTVQGTGHAEIASLRTGLAITTRGMTSVLVDPATRTARVSAGSTWREVIRAADPHGLTPVSGSAPDVGVVGLLLGGGVGPVARSLGACSDHVRAVHLVVPGRGERTVDAAHEPELFGALLGGRPGVGVVTGVDVALLPRTPLHAGGFYYGPEDIPAVVDGYRSWLAAGVPDGITTSLAILRIPDLPVVPPPLAGRTVAHLRVAAVGPVTDRDVVPFRLRRIAQPLLGAVAALPWARIGDIHSDPVTPRVHVGGGLLLNDLDADAADALLAAAGPDVSVPLSIVEVRHLGGAVATAPDDRPDCVPGRDAAHGLWVSSQPFALKAADQDPGRAGAARAVRQTLDALAAWSPGAAAINFSGSANTPAEIDRGWSPAAHAHLADVTRCAGAAAPVGGSM